MNQSHGPDSLLEPARARRCAILLLWAALQVVPVLPCRAELVPAHSTREDLVVVAVGTHTLTSHREAAVEVNTNGQAVLRPGLILRRGQLIWTGRSSARLLLDGHTLVVLTPRTLAAVLPPSIAPDGRRLDIIRLFTGAARLDVDRRHLPAGRRIALMTSRVTRTSAGGALRAVAPERPVRSIESLDLATLVATASRPLPFDDKAYQMLSRPLAQSLAGPSLPGPAAVRPATTDRAASEGWSKMVQAVAREALPAGRAPVRGGTHSKGGW